MSGGSLRASRSGDAHGKQPLGMDPRERWIPSGAALCRLGKGDDTPDA